MCIMNYILKNDINKFFFYNNNTYIHTYIHTYIQTF